MSSAKAQRLADDAIEYTDFSSDIDLSDYAMAMVKVITAGTGSLVVEPRSPGGTDRTYTVSDGEEIPVDVRKIDSATNVDRVRVYIWL